MRTVPLRRLVASVDNGSWGDEADADAGVTALCIRGTDFAFDKLRVDLRRAPTRSFDERTLNRLKLHAGDIVLEKSGGGDNQPVGRSVLFDHAETAVATNFAARLRPAGGVDSRYLVYVLRHLYDSGATARAIKQTTGIQNLDMDAWLTTAAPRPKEDEQRRIADFLDDRVSQIDRIIAARREQFAQLAKLNARLSYDCVRGVNVGFDRRESRLEWLGSIPTGWPVLSVSSQFVVELGKMLDDKKQTGEHRLPYLRNTNVQWDQIAVRDLKEMDIPESEYSRFTVEPGDLLICEGGQPGRSAIWTGEIRPLGYQKALHRARSRGRSRPEWLLECLRVAVELNVFGVASGQTTIAHLTNEQLRAQRFPFPDPQVQDTLLADLHGRRRDNASLVRALNDSIGRLTEYKASLITAAVTGEVDATTAGSNIPG